MARREQDREDIFAEASALVRRVEMDVNGEIVVAGFRRDGAPSVYFGQDFVVGFNPSGAVRRIFHNGVIYRAETGRSLTSLRRHREQGTSDLLSRPANNAETSQLVSLIEHRLQQLLDSMESRTVRLLRSEPGLESDEVVVAEVASALRMVLQQRVRIADGMRE